MTNTAVTPPSGQSTSGKKGTNRSEKVSKFFGITVGNVEGVVAGATAKPATPAETYEKLLQAVEGEFAVLAKDPTQKIDWNGRIAELKKVDPSKDYEGSIFNLKKLQKGMHEQISNDFKGIKKNVETWGKEQKEFEIKRGNVIKLVDQLSEYTGRGDAVLKARLEIDQAGGLCRDGDIGGGLTQLGELETFLNKEMKTADERQKAAKSNLKSLTEKLASVETLLQKGADVLSSDSLAAFTRRYETEASKIENSASLAKDQEARKKITTVIDGSLTTLLSDLGRDVGTAKDRFDGVTEKLRKLNADANARGSAQASSDAEQVFHILQGAREQIAARNWDEADKALNEAETLLKGWAPALPVIAVEGDKKLNDKAKAENEKAQKALWDAAQKFLKDGQAEIDKAQKMRADNPKATFLDRLPVTVDGIDAILADPMRVAEQSVARFVVSDGLEAVKQARAANAANRTRLGDFAKLGEVRDQQTKEIETLAGQVADAIATLKKAMADPKLPLPTYEDPLADARKRWAAGAEIAMTEAELPAEAVKAALNAILNAIKTDKGSPAKLIATEKDSQLAALTKSFGEKTRFATDAADRAGDQNFLIGDDLLAEIRKTVAAFSALKPGDEKAAADLIKAMDELGKKATKADADEKKKVAAAKTAFDDGIARIEVIFESLNKLVDIKRFTTGKVEKYLGNFEAMVKEFSVLSASGASTDVGVLQAGATDLATFEKRAGDMLSLFQKLRDGKVGPNDVTIDSLEKRGTDVNKKFDLDKDLAKLIKTELDAIKAECSAVVDAIETTPLDTSTKKFNDIETKWTALEKKARERGVDRDKFLTEVGTVSTMMTSTSLPQKFPTLADSLTARLKTLSDAATATGDVDRDALAKLRKELESSIASDTFARTGQQQVETAALDKALSDKRWAAEYTAFQGKLKALEDIAGTLEGPSVKAFNSQRSELKTSAESLNKSSKNTPYETLHTQLQSLVARVDLMIRYPMGQATHARGSLLAVDQRWNQAITDFARDLGTFDKDLTAAIGDDIKEPGVVEAVATAQKRAVGLAKLFTAGTLTPLVKAVVTAGNMPAKNKAEAAKRMAAARDAREIALADVKRLQRTVEAHPHLVALGRVPFDVKIKAAIGNLRLALFDLETNLLISL